MEMPSRDLWPLRLVKPSSIVRNYEVNISRSKEIYMPSKDLCPLRLLKAYVNRQGKQRVNIRVNRSKSE